MGAEEVIAVDGDVSQVHPDQAGADGGNQGVDDALHGKIHGRMALAGALLFVGCNLGGHGGGRGEEGADAVAADHAAGGTQNHTDHGIREPADIGKTHAHHAQGEGSQGGLEGETVAFFCHDSAVEDQHDGHGGEGGGIDNGNLEAVQAHGAGDQHVLAGQEHLKAQIEAAVDDQPCPEGGIAQGHLDAVDHTDGFFFHRAARVFTVLGNGAGHGGVFLDQEDGQENGQRQGRHAQSDDADVHTEADKHGNQGIGDGILDGVEGGLDVGQQEPVVVGGGDFRVSTEQGVDGQGEEGHKHGQQHAAPDGIGHGVLFIADGEAEEHIGQSHHDGAHQDGGTAPAPGGFQILDEGCHGHLHQAVHQGGDGLHDAEQAHGNDGLAGEGPLGQVRAEAGGLQGVHQVDGDDGAEHTGAEGGEGEEGDLPSFQFSHRFSSFLVFLKNADAFFATLEPAWGD